jgi:hypothetical protein
MAMTYCINLILTGQLAIRNKSMKSLFRAKNACFFRARMAVFDHCNITFEDDWRENLNDVVHDDLRASLLALRQVGFGVAGNDEAAVCVTRSH